MFIYLHGLNSSSQSRKARWLAQRVAPRTFLAPDYNAHLVDESLEKLNQFIFKAVRRTDSPATPTLTLIGSSLGGVYAQYLAKRFNAAIVLINPALLPRAQLLEHLGPQFNHATGQSYELLVEHVDRLNDLRQSNPPENIDSLLLVDEGDEVIPFRFAVEFYKNHGNTVIYPGGSHAFDHMEAALPLILEIHDQHEQKTRRKQ